MNASDLRDTIIIPTLEGMGYSHHGVRFLSDEAVQLLLGTAAHESMGFTRRTQMGGGPALGLWQMEPDTERDIWSHYLPGKSELTAFLRGLVPFGIPLAKYLEDNDQYACAMARIQYARNSSKPIPLNLEEQAEYWDEFYNRNPNVGTPEEYVSNYHRYIKGDAA